MDPGSSIDVFSQLITISMLNLTLTLKGHFEAFKFALHFDP